jgi:hypothetical protein
MADKNNNSKDTKMVKKEFLNNRTLSIIAIASTIICYLLSRALFDHRLSFATDDATYLVNALAFLSENNYPTYQGALYPLVLAFFIKVFGYDILMLKSLSAIFLTASIPLAFFALRNRITPILLAGLMLFMALNPYLLAYGSFTYSEPLFIFLECLFLLVFLRTFDAIQLGSSKAFIGLVVSAFVIFLAAITRTVALFAILAPVILLIINKKFIHSAVLLVSFLAIFFGYRTITKSVYKTENSAQFQQLLQKDFNDPSQGNVSAGDLIERFQQNYANYIGMHLYKIMGFGDGVSSVFSPDKVKDPTAILPQGELVHPKSNTLLGLLILLIALAALYTSFIDKNNTMLLLTLFVGAMLGVTFFALQSFWNQDRLIIPFVGFVVIIIAYAFEGIGKWRNIAQLKFVGWGFLALVVLLSASKVFSDTSKASKHQRAYKRSKSLIAGYPTEIETYLQGVMWAKDSLKVTDLVACGKPEEARALAHPIRFTRISNVNDNVDTLISDLNKKGFTHLLYHPRYAGKSAQAIQNLTQKKPQSLELVLQQGNTNMGVFIFELKK